jgi:hypothetical protein
MRVYVSTEIKNKILARDGEYQCTDLSCSHPGGKCGGALTDDWGVDLPEGSPEGRVPQHSIRSNTHREGQGVITFAEVRPGPTKQIGAWDVMAWSAINVVCDKEKEGEYYSWSSNLVYMDRGDGAGPHWYELAFFKPQSAPNPDQPFAMDRNEDDFELAVGSAMHSVRLAFGPSKISGDGLPAFLERWVDRFADAMLGNLSHPSHLPLGT